MRFPLKRSFIQNSKRVSRAKRRTAILQSLEPRQVLNAGSVVFSEIQYNPAGSDTANEWIELHNQLSVNVDISGWQLDDGVQYQFPVGTVVSAGDYLVVSNDPAAASDPATFGPFEGSLSNGGENLELKNISGRLIDAVEYDDAGDWPVAPDGSGVTLAKFRVGTASDDPSSWRSSGVVGGSPGTVNVVPAPSALISEVEILPTSKRIELQVDQDGAVNLNGYVIEQSGSSDDQAVLSSGVVAAGSYVSFDLAEIGLDVQPGDTLLLRESMEGTVLDALIAESGTIARSDELDGRWVVPDAPTFGSVNSFAFRNEIVINEISYHDAPQFLETSETQNISETELLAFNADWRYNESGENLGTNWFQTTNSVGGNWQSGPGLLGFETSPLPQPIQTTFANPNSNSIITYYFETEFDVPAEQLSETTSIELTHIVDDGAVFYVNGVEFARFGMPSGDVTSSTFASGAIGDASAISGIEIPSNLLNVGTNRISVQVHQRGEGSSDVVFGAQILARTTTQLGAVPFADDDLEWIELYNRSSQSVSLADWQLSDAVRFEFDPGTTVAADGYLVVTNDRTAFLSRYTSVDPAIVLGDFSGKLSNGGERIQLLDEIGNPADEVQYADGGRWSKAADGGGSTLELRDPDGDNSIAESWVASDESGKTEWETVTYRGIAGNPAGTSFPGNFNEFLLGLLDQGEVLLDDISVVQDPNGAARQLIQNGSFSSDTIGESADKWRILGTHGSHGLTQVIVDPTNPGNQVLHLVATGPTYHLTNHAETTLKDGGTFVSIQDGTEYEISYRAKWISGSPQLTTRLYFNKVAQTNVIDTPESSGTPGELNTAAIANAGPTFTQFAQSIAVPAPNQPVVISARVSDNDSVTRTTLFFSKNGGPWQQTSMDTGADGLSRATISGSPDGTIVQFYVEAEDSLGAISTFPAEGANSRALFRVEASSASPTGASNFRIITTMADSDLLHDPTNVMSNDLIGATVVYDDVVYHDIGVRLKSSSRGRWRSTRVGFTVKFDPAQPFRGLFNTVNIDRSGPGRGGAPGLFGQGEIVNWHVINRVGGVPGFSNDLVYVVAPRDSESSSAQLVLTSYRNDYLDSAYENGSDGQLYELSSVYSPKSVALVDPSDRESLKLFGSGLDDVRQTEVRDLGNDRETYRHNYLIENNEEQDNLEFVIELAKTFSLPKPQFDAVIADVIDVEVLMRTAAVMSLLSPVDNYFGGGNTNVRLYQRPDGKFEFLPWDHDFQSGSFSANNFNELVRQEDIRRVIDASPDYRRLFYANLVDMMNTTFNTAYMTQWTSHYNSLVSGGQNFGEILAFIGNRNSAVTARVNADVPAIGFGITTNGGSNFSVNDSSAQLAGTGWLDIESFRIAGTDTKLDVNWTSDTNWVLTVPLEPGANAIVLEAVGFDGQVLDNDNITITSTNSSFPQRDFLRITEFHYNSPGGDDEFEFIELTNIGAETLDASGATISEGPSDPFVVPANTLLAAGESLVIARDPVAFAAAYDSLGTTSLLGPFAGSLSNGGETITLVDSGGAEIMSVEYDDGGLWSDLADGEGVSLELVDAATPNDRLDKFYSWRPSTQFGGSPGSPRLAASGVVISEVLAHTDLPRVDTIELFNSTSQPVDISGWWLSDDSNDYLQYQIPTPTILDAGGYATFDETQFNPDPPVPGVSGFRLSSGGESIYLTQASGGEVSRLEDAVDFGASFNGQSFGRTPTSPARMAPLVRSSLGATNGAFAFADVVISEVNYHPSDPSSAAIDVDPAITDNDLEFIELYNRTEDAIDLSDWSISGDVELEFANGPSIGSGEALVLVSFDPANTTRLNAFRTHFAMDASTPIAGPLSGSLNNSYGLVQLNQPDTPDADGIPLVTVDEVVYDDLAPWDVSADGQGDSLHRIAPSTLGAFAASWTGESPTPGQIVRSASVSSVTINNDAPGRSEVTSIEVVFDSVAAVDASNFELTHIGDDNRETTVTGVNVLLGQSGGQTTATLTFDATNFTLAGTNPSIAATLADGRYELRYRDLGFSTSEVRVDSFFRKYGDSDGSNLVGLADFADFRSSFGIEYSSSDPNNGYNSGLDADRNGIVSLVDFAAFRSAFGK